MNGQSERTKIAVLIHCGAPSGRKETPERSIIEKNARFEIAP